MKQRTHCQTLLVIAAIAMTVLAINQVSAQTTNAFDQASDPAYSAGTGGGNNLGNLGNPDGGYGFGPWSFTLTGNGGAFIQTYGPSGDSFDLWNTSANSSTVAVRPFSTPLSPGDSFTVAIRLNSLDNTTTTNRFALEDASGNILFSYWHWGNEPNGAVNGWYSDATTNNGVATNFQYAYQQFVTYKFTLNSATTYTFSDLATGASFTGTIANTSIAQAAFIRVNGSSAPGNGQDYQFDQLIVISAAPPTFQAISPAPNALSVATNATISLNVLSGGTPLNTGATTLKLDGNPVTPTITGNSSLMGISYTPASPFGYATTHTVEVVVQDNNVTTYTNTWNFTTGYASLPVTLPGPINVVYATNGDAGVTIFTAAGEGWLGTNYNANAVRTLYARFSMVFNNLNGETGTGGGYGGLHFIQDDAQKLIVGNDWVSTNWSLEANGSQMDLTPLLPVVLGEWHTIVERIDFVPNAPDNVKIWLDPDFNQTEANQPNAPLTLSTDVSFNNIRLRCGNGTASATWTNIVVGSSSTDVGFVQPAEPVFQNYVPTVNASSAPISSPIGVDVLFGSYGIGTNTVVMTLDGNQVNPSFTVNASSISMSYQPPSAFTPGSAHTVQVSLTDSNNTPYSTTWSFTADSFPALPVTSAGPFDVSENTSVTLWDSQNGWISGKYGPDSTNTLYTKFSMVFYAFPQTDPNAGGSFGGLQFFQDNTERLITGNAWVSTNWSADAKESGEPDLMPTTPIVVGDLHTIVIKSVYASNAPTAESIWLDPDFTKSLSSQPQAPLTVSMNNTFNQVRLRCGNGSTFAEFSDIVIAATAQDLGFPAVVPPGSLNIQNGQLSWTGDGTLQSAPAVTGPWTDAANQSNPQGLSTTNSAEFYRLRQ